MQSEKERYMHAMPGAHWQHSNLDAGRAGTRIAPASAYDAIVNPRVESTSSKAISAFMFKYAASPFSINLIARSSEEKVIG